MLGDGRWRDAQGRSFAIGGQKWRGAEISSPSSHLLNGKLEASSVFFAVQRPAICIRPLQYLRFGDVAGQTIRLEIAGASTIS
ncbi:hypothetical protein [Rhizobium sp. CF142]|uniref:hypothetical protein n=1 Tax=Rhizobium sp. CF142 TaxID=1144314 RepID=UPI0012F69E93|nr:hypothetical protein [Rhizobium sp. CF142]